MNVTGTVWAVTLAGIAVIFVADYLIMGRKARVVGMKEAAITAGFYVLLAAVGWLTATAAGSSCTLLAIVSHACKCCLLVARLLSSS